MITVERFTFKNTLYDAYFPTRSDVEGLQVGDYAPSVLGRSKVTRIFARGNDIDGRAFVCFYAGFGKDSTISSSLKEDEISLQLSLCNKIPSHDLSMIEKTLRHRRTADKASKGR